MRRILALLPIFAVVLAGCTDLSGGPVPTEVVVKEVQPPQMKPSKLLYISPPGTDSKQLKVGDSQNEVSDDFPEPKSAFIFRSLPPGFASRYSAWGYNTADLSFGVIYFGEPDENGSRFHDKVALAMTKEEGLTEDVVLSTEQQYADDFGMPSTVTGKLVRYWFWSDPQSSQSFMLCAVVSKDSKQADHFELTAALGDDVVMQYLGMDVAHAKKDGQVLDKSPLKFTQGPPPPVGGTSSDTENTTRAPHRVYSRQESVPPATDTAETTGTPTGTESPTTGAASSSTATTTGDTGANQTTPGTTGATPGTVSPPADSKSPPDPVLGQPH